MQTTVGILTFISMINFIFSLSWVWQKFLQPRGQAKMKKIAKNDDTCINAWTMANIFNNLQSSSLSSWQELQSRSLSSWRWCTTLTNCPFGLFYHSLRNPSNFSKSVFISVTGLPHRNISRQKLKFSDPNRSGPPLIAETFCSSSSGNRFIPGNKFSTCQLSSY